MITFDHVITHYLNNGGEGATHIFVSPHLWSCYRSVRDACGDSIVSEEGTLFGMTPIFVHPIDPFYVEYYRFGSQFDEKK